MNLAAGDTIDDIVEKINTVMETNNLDIIAENDGGILKLKTDAYGTSATFKVVSDQDGGTSEQTGIGTTEIVAKGTNIQGTIGGKAAKGNGLILTGLAGYDAEGLSVRIENNATGFIDNINFSQGIFNQLESLVDSFTDSINGTITERITGLENQVEDIDNSIEKMETLIEKKQERLEAQFVALESMLATLQSQSDYLSSVLGNLSISSS